MDAGPWGFASRVNSWPPLFFVLRSLYSFHYSSQQNQSSLLAELEQNDKNKPFLQLHLPPASKPFRNPPGVKLLHFWFPACLQTGKAKGKLNPEWAHRPARCARRSLCKKKKSWMQLMHFLFDSFGVFSICDNSQCINSIIMATRVRVSAWIVLGVVTSWSSASASATALVHEGCYICARGLFLDF